VHAAWLTLTRTCTGELLSEQDVGDVNDVAGALKLYVRELPEPLCTYSNFKAFCATLAIADAAVRLEETRATLQLTPAPNQHLLATLCSMLYIVSRNHAVNKMHVSNLALVFGPNVLQPDPAAAPDLAQMSRDSNAVIAVVSYLIDEAEALFESAQSARPVQFHARLLGHNERVMHVAQTDDVSLMWSIDASGLLRITSTCTLLFECAVQLSGPVYALLPHGATMWLAFDSSVEVRVIAFASFASAHSHRVR
jgi:hypothetical protein